MLARIRRATRNDRGASAVEYGLLVGAIAAIIVVVVFALGRVVNEVFGDTCEEITSEEGPSPIELTADCGAPAAP